MEKVEYIVVGHFRYVDDTKSAIQRLQEKGKADDFELYSPLPNHELEELIYAKRKRSNVRRFTLLGGIAGLLGGFLMTSWMSLDWPLRVSAKPILSYPAFVVIAYECTILLGAIFTLLGMLFLSGVPSLRHAPGFRPTFSEGTFGLVVRSAKGAVDEVKELLQSSGAAEVEVQYVR